ncbi:PREDICTED: plant cysteine oxidase 2-like [Ipomoea nil]|uniref:plant cysteine oxidase 2-like n=1 Tax=Ipomoea nil TaxID=35883 RepID=UPI0009010F14|nr:PREDICTED: plant cysteine oxidase 2-like [Ipomoea nil]
MAMGVDKNASDRKGKSVEPSKHRRGQQRRVMAVQNLYETCREVFANCGPDIVPSPENVERVKAILDKMTGMDVGLRPTMPYFKPTMPYFKPTRNDRPPEIAYMRIHECDKFSIGIFCLPPKAVIPLHNHPGMTVFSKILFGKMHVQSYDWADAGPGGNGNPDGVRLAKVKVNSEFSAPCETNLLYPNDCNMHCFRALTACAFLDVVVPPYNDLEGRHCQYYVDYPFANFSDEGATGPEVAEDQKESYVWLKEREVPEDLKFVGALYNGPKLVK